MIRTGSVERVRHLFLHPRTAVSHQRLTSSIKR